MIRKNNPNDTLSLNNYYGSPIVDEFGGSGSLRVEGVGQGTYVQEPRPTNIPAWQHWYGRGHHEYPHYRVVGSAFPDTYERGFSLKVYEGGLVLPASVDGATLVTSINEANALADKWLAAGGPGLGLEHPDATKQRRLEANSSYALGKASHWLGQLTDADLTKLAEMATDCIAKRAERTAKAAAKLAEKQLKAAEKARIAAEKLAVKAAKEAAKAEKARIAAEKAAEKQRKAAEKAAKVTPE